MILLTTLNLHHTGEFLMRLAPLMIGTLNLYILFRIGKHLFNQSTGIIAMLLGAASVYNAVIAGTFVSPDAPMTFFWLISIWLAVRFIQTEKISALLLFGITTGLTMLSKYHGAFLWAGMFGYLLFYNRKQLKNKYLYLSILFTLVLFTPVIWWNFDNHLASFAFHRNRTLSTIFNFKTLGLELTGQLAYNNPLNVIVIILSVVAFFKHRKEWQTPELRPLLWLSLPLIATVILLSCFNRTQPHWSAPSYYGLILISAFIIEKHRQERKKRCIALILRSNILLVVLGIASLLHIQIGLTPYPQTVPKEKQGRGDFTLDMFGYDQMGAKVDAWFENSDLSEGGPISLITHKWFPGGHLEYYLSAPYNHKLYVCGTPAEMHNFMKINNKNGFIAAGSNACYITLSNFYKPLPKEVSEQFETIGSSEEIAITRNNRIVYYVFLHPLYGARKTIDMNSVIDGNEK